MEHLDFVFEVKPPRNGVESDINTLILQLHDLMQFNKLENKSEMEIKLQNDLIDRMKRTLDNMKITIIE